MNAGCDYFRELMLDARTVPLLREQAGEVEQHIKACAACRTYGEALEADDRLLSDFAEAMGPTVAGIEADVCDWWPLP